jgi:hypothetical protein
MSLKGLTGRSVSNKDWGLTRVMSGSDELKGVWEVVKLLKVLTEEVKKLLKFWLSKGRVPELSVKKVCVLETVYVSSKSWVSESADNKLIDFEVKRFELRNGSSECRVVNACVWGVNSYKDWSKNDNYKYWRTGQAVLDVKITNVTELREYPIPDSCCDEETHGTKNCGLKLKTKPYTKGCLEAIEHNLEDNLAKIGGAAIGISVFEIIVICLSFFLARHFAKKDEFYKTMAWQSEIDQTLEGHFSMIPSDSVSVDGLPL